MRGDLDPDRSALFLDFDGTLVEIAPRPDAVRVPVGLPALLRRLHHRFGGAVAVVSGRPVAEIDAFLGPAVLPVCGLHGLDWRPDPGRAPVRPPPPASIEDVRAVVAASGLGSTGVRVEDKGHAIALHYREAPDREEQVRALAAALADGHPDLALLDGKMVLELKPAGASKAAAVERFLDEPVFAGRTPVFVGDDVTDEDGMRAAQERGGFAVKVGDGASRADRRMPDVPAVHRWLAALTGG